MSETLTPAAKRDIAAHLHPYTNLARHEEVGPLVLTHGKGIYVYDEQGREYIEGLAGLWCTSLGFGEDALVQAALEQMQRLPYYHTFAHKSHPMAIALAERLKALAPAPMSKVFFTNSGSEANDTVIKMVWYHNNALGRPEKKKIISRRRGYHGVTIASASLTGLPINHNDFDLPIARILHTDCPHHYRFAEPGESEEDFATRLAASLERLIVAEGPETVAAFIAEPVMGAGGVIVPPRTYFPKIQAVLRKHDVLLIADEVICGFGRTGNYWGCETYDLQPDILVCSKAITSGYLPLAAILVSEAVYAGVREGSRRQGTFGHGFTQSGNPTCTAVGLRTLELMEERRIVEHVREVAPRFQEGLRAFAEHPLVGEARGVGLLGGLELVADQATKQPFDPAQRVGMYCAERAQAHGLIVRPMVDTIGFCPPLIIDAAQIDELFARFGQALDETQAWVRRG
ncbi:MAG TPA: aspartate aminotransferase family protein [bacterium]